MEKPSEEAKAKERKPGMWLPHLPVNCSLFSDSLPLMKKAMK